MKPPPAPGLAPPVAEHRDSPRSALKTAAFVGLVVLAFSLFVGRDDDRGLVPDPAALVIALLTGGLLGLHALRSATAAGPGWLATHRIKGHSWVRTDELVEVRAGRGIGSVNLRMRDRDGRRVFVPWSEIERSPKLAGRVRKDVQTSVTAGAELDALSTEILLGRRR